MVGQVPSIRAPQYGQQASATMAQFDANAAQRRLAEAEALNSVLSNAESAQNVFGAGALANIASTVGGFNPDNFNADFIRDSDLINQAGRNADVINTLAQASERMPDHIINPAAMNGQLPQMGAPMVGHVDAGDRAAFANANAIREAALKANVDPDAFTVTITDAEGNTTSTTMDMKTYLQSKTELAPDGLTLTIDPFQRGPLTNNTNKAGTPLVTGDHVDVTGGTEAPNTGATQPTMTQPEAADMTGGTTASEPIEAGRQTFEKQLRAATGNPNATVTVEGNEYVATDGAGKELFREKIE